VGQQPGSAAEDGQHPEELDDLHDGAVERVEFRRRHLDVVLALRLLGESRHLTFVLPVGLDQGDVAQRLLYDTADYSGEGQ
jgi:hypothetical protein